MPMSVQRRIHGFDVCQYLATARTLTFTEMRASIRRSGWVRARCAQHRIKRTGDRFGHGLLVKNYKAICKVKKSVPAVQSIESSARNAMAFFMRSFKSNANGALAAVNAICP